MQRVTYIGLAIIEITALSALILATRCANYQDVFVAGNVYFTDADCYARMTRARMCSEYPGLIVRHHDFENFPTGTTPHATAPLDYLILALSILLQPFTSHALDLGGAFISPLLALLGGWFLWWWSRRMRFQYRWMMLILYAISPILVHGTELGRPDHQSLLILLLGIAVCAEWRLRREPSTPWSAISGIAWGLAIWVSAYEPVILLLLILLLGAVQDRHLVFGKQRCTGWILLAGIVALTLLIERRIPSFSTFYSGGLFKNWSGTIGELAHVSPANPIWLRWAGYLILVAPFLIWFGLWKRKSKNTSETTPLFFVVLLVATYLLTIWQARWAYFFLLIFAIALPALLEPIMIAVLGVVVGGIVIAMYLPIFDLISKLT